MPQPPLIILFGGSSNERRVSVASAQNIAACLPDAGCWFVDPTERITVCPITTLLQHTTPFTEDFDPRAGITWPNVAAALQTVPKNTVFIVALHGGSGEDGSWQRLFEQTGHAFTGSGSVASAMAFDKRAAKQAVSTHDIQIAPTTFVQEDVATIEQSLQAAFDRYGSLVAKPVASGSSLGLHIISDRNMITMVAQLIAATGLAYLIEPFIQGTELTVGVIEEAGGRRALPPSEIRTKDGATFDFAGKYLGHSSQEITPAEIPASLAAEAQQLALTAHAAIGAYGYSRTDMIANDQGITFLEINTLPGLSSASFIPQQLKASGRNLKNFLHDQINLAIQRSSQ